MPGVVFIPKMLLVFHRDRADLKHWELGNMLTAKHYNRILYSIDANPSAVF